MADLSYTLGLDAGGFAAAANKALGMMGHMELAIQLVNRAASAAMSAFDKAADMETTEVAINTILKDAQATKGVMEELKRIGAQTPFEMSDLAPAARALLGAGTATKDLSKQLIMLGDIASGANTDIGGLVTVFNQIRGKGKLMADDFQQLAERGVAGLREEIAKFKGIDVSAVADMLSAGGVSARDLEGIFARMTGTGGLFFQSMANQSQTFAGKLSTLADGWSALQVAFATPINDALKPVLDDLTALSTTMTPAFEAIGSQVAEVLGDFRNFVQQISTGEDALEAFSSSFGDLIGMVSEFASVFIGAFADGFPELALGIFAAMGPALEWIAGKLEVAALRFGSLMQSEAARVVEALPLNLGGGAAAALNQGAMNSATQAMHVSDRVNALDMSGGLAPARDLLSKSVLDMAEGFQGRLDGFTRGQGQDVSAAVSQPEPAPDWIDRILAAAAPPIAQPFAQAGMQSSPQEVQASLVRLDAILNELQKLNTF